MVIVTQTEGGPLTIKIDNGAISSGNATNTFWGAVQALSVCSNSTSALQVKEVAIYKEYVLSSQDQTDECGTGNGRTWNGTGWTIL